MGNSESGQSSSSVAPVEVTGITDAIKIAAGGRNTCALHQDGTVSCWGNNAVGQLGDGNSGKGEHSPVPVKVQGITNAIAVSASVGYYLGHSCALLEDGTISCWGMNGSGQLGTGQSAEGDISSVPASVQGITDATAISTGEEHSCALHEGGTISCWGNMEAGRLGNGSSPWLPQKVIGLGG